MQKLYWLAVVGGVVAALTVDLIGGIITGRDVVN